MHLYFLTFLSYSTIGPHGEGPSTVDKLELESEYKSCVILEHYLLSQSLRFLSLSIYLFVEWQKCDNVSTANQCQEPRFSINELFSFLLLL